MSFAVSEILALTQGRLANEGELGSAIGGIRVERPAPLASAGAGDVAFFFSREYEKEVVGTRAGVLITGEAFVKPIQAAKPPFWGKTAVIACKDPYLALAILSEKFAQSLSPSAHLASTGDGIIHPTAVVHPTAKVAKSVSVGAHSVVEADAVIGEGSVVYPGCYIGPKVSIGERCVLFPGVKIYEWCRIGNRVRLHAGAVIGSDGFGYAPIRDGAKVVGHQKIYHVGKVVIGDDVEVGANTCVDRGTFDDTILERNVKLDNLVQVGHNARLEEGAVVCGKTGLAGSTRLGRYCYVGGLTGVANKVHIGDGASVAALTLVSKDVPAYGTALGNPQRAQGEHFKAHALLNRLLSDRKKAPKKETE
jgi:UDP-3-O-[3-hydroxymyristoyl] glucosamine N-acyltransferase